jgi:acetylglutamate kinase
MVLKDVVLLRTVGMNPILVHGGGPEISEMMRRLGKEPETIQGLRVTDDETMRIVEMVLIGSTNQGIVAAINTLGGRAVGLSGKDASLLVARKYQAGGVDLGRVGEVEEVNPAVIEALTAQGYIPVIAPIAVGRDGAAYNVNADHAAGTLAAALKATKLLVLSDVRGVLRDRKDEASLVSTLTAAQAEQMIGDGRIESGMIPKVQGCIAALRGGVPRCHLIDGRLPHALLMEIFTDVGIGTMLTLE